MLKVLGSYLSPFVRKVRVCLAEKSIEYQHEDLIPMLAPDSFTELSPLRRVPVLEDSDVTPTLVLPDSSAICQYLERRFPDIGLYPSDPALFGRALWIEEYADTEFSNCIGQSVFRPVVVDALLGAERDLETARSTVKETLPKYFGYFESQLSSDEFLFGRDLTVADVSVAVHFQNLKHAGYELSEAEYPKLGAFVDRMLSRQSFISAFKEEQAFLKISGFETRTLFEF